MYNPSHIAEISVDVKQRIICYLLWYKLVFIHLRWLNSKKIIWIIMLKIEVLSLTFHAYKYIISSIIHSDIII